jgi:hypothetical protein
MSCRGGQAPPELLFTGDGAGSNREWTEWGRGAQARERMLTYAPEFGGDRVNRA